MELAVLTITAIGVFLFSISYIKFDYEGFRHHFVTGLLALIPVVNLIALPTLWDRTRGMLLIGLGGLIAAIIAWFAGADKAFEASQTKARLGHRARRGSTSDTSDGAYLRGPV